MRLDKIKSLLHRKSISIVLPFFVILYPKLSLYLKQFNVTAVFNSTNALSIIIKNCEDLVD